MIPLPNLTLASTATSAARGGTSSAPVTGSGGVPQMLLYAGVAALVAMLVLRGR